MTRLAEAIAAVPIVAILRARQEGPLDEVIDVLVESGIRAIEVTAATPGALEAVQRAAGSHLQAAIGVGSVLDVNAIDAIAGAGASFIVSPHADAAIVHAARAAGLDSLPGAATATEALTMQRSGATAVKLFPARSLGPAFVSDLLAPAPSLRLVPVGGVDVADVAAYLRAGAIAVGVGSPLIGDALAGGSLRDLARRADAFVDEAS